MMLAQTDTGVLTEMLDHGKWLALHINGEFYGDKPPIYFWLLAALSWIFQTREPSVFFLLAAMNAAAMIYATLFLARHLCRGHADIALVAYTRDAPDGGLDLGPRPSVRRWIARVEQKLGLEPRPA